MSHTQGASGNATDPGIAGFWDAISSAPQVALLLDYDGTLAPFHVDRLKAFPVEGAAEALQELTESTDTIVALVSGRPVQEILQLIADPGVTIIGTHGYEVRDPDADIASVTLDETQVSLLDRAYTDARRFIGSNRTERKVATVAAHFRGLDRIDARQFQDDILHKWLSYADTSIVEVRQFNGGIEMRLRGRDKGVAVGEFLDRYPETTLPVYIGDDDTDEDAFREVKRRGGFAIRVGERTSSTEATGFLPACEDVVAFLLDWIEVRRKS